MSSDRTTFKPEDLSYCGVDCKACDVFKATVYKDNEARLRAAQRWEKTAQKHWGMQELDPAILDCAGCRTTDVAHNGYGRCPIRLCAKDRNLLSCGLCPQWRECEHLEEVFADEPQAIRMLEMIEKGASQWDSTDGK